MVKDWWEKNKVSEADTASNFAERVFTPLYGNVVIPYLPLIKLYTQWLTPKLEAKQGVRLCFCGCGDRILSDFKKFASDACKKRYQREQQRLKILQKAEVNNFS